MREGPDFLIIPSMTYTTRIAHTEADVDAALEVRRIVFVEGQGVGYEIERDGLDDEAVHAVVELEGQIVGAGRMVPQPSGDGGTVARIGRMAVLLGHRRQGMATAVLRALEEEAKRRGWTSVELHAQSYVHRLYARAGYRVVGEPFMEAEIEHVTMVKAL